MWSLSVMHVTSPLFSDIEREQDERVLLKSKCKCVATKIKKGIFKIYFIIS
jgi:hypothetical protein